MNKIFLIGNGFDLGHGLATSYKSFISWYLLQCLESAFKSGGSSYEDECLSFYYGRRYTNPQWHDTLYKILNDAIVNENLSSLIVDTIDGSFRSSIKPPQRNITYPTNNDFDIYIKCKNNFIKSILKNCLNSDWNGIEYEIYRFISLARYDIKNKYNGPDVRSNQTYINKTEEIKQFNSIVSHLKCLLAKYLTEQNILKSDKSNWFNIPLGDIMDGDQSDLLFLNFNYTTYFYEQLSILKTRYSKKIRSYDIINIHGTVEESADDMVFGVGDEQNDFYLEIESDYGNDWLKNMKSFHYFKNDRYQQLLSFPAKGDYEIYVMGHSCSTTDRTLLNMLFENQYCKSIYIFHYNGIESYLNTTYNIARNFKDKVKMREVVHPFNRSLKM